MQSDIEIKPNDPQTIGMRNISPPPRTLNYIPSEIASGAFSDTYYS